jgi:hypothetical protein
MLAVVTLALGACSSGKAGNDTDVPSATGQQQAPPELSVDNSERAVPVALPSPSPISSIPAAFHGRWGMVPNDCEPGRADAKGLMTISADKLAFYESRATFAQLRQVTPNQLTGSLNYDGEGQHWTKQTTLTLQDAGKTLIREEADPAGAQTYSKCPDTNG